MDRELTYWVLMAAAFVTAILALLVAGERPRRIWLYAPPPLLAATAIMLIARR